MKLSICIATVPERAAQFAVLFAELSRQANGRPVKIEVDDRPKLSQGGVSVGTKRQDLNASAIGDYVVHLDDDDWIPSDYVDTILNALESNPDCVGHYELVEGLSERPQLSIWTNKAQRWMQGREARPFGTDFVRTPFHKTPIRRELAVQIPFKDMTFGEDHDWSIRLKESRLIKSEAFIPRVLYFYRYVSQDHNTKYGIK